MSSSDEKKSKIILVVIKKTFLIIINWSYAQNRFLHVLDDLSLPSYENKNC